MEPIRRLIRASSMKRQETSQGVASAMVIEAANGILGAVLPASLAGAARGKSFRDGTLKIACAHSATAQEVRLRQDDIIERLNVRFGAGTVRRLAIR